MIRLVPIAVLATLVCSPVAAQTAMEGVPYRQPYGIVSFGAFRMLVMSGDFSPKVNLGAVMTTHPTVGVGALTEARGEITIYDGKLILSYATPDARHPAAEAESAALLAIARASAWQTIPVERDIAPGEIEDFIAKMAATHAINSEGPFPFEVRGTIGPFVRHVNAAPTNGPHGMGQPIAITAETKGDAVAGMVAGIYASRDLVGIVSHGGTRTHSHWIAADEQSTAHLDSWGIKAGAVLSLPKP
jgi:alpha-acetolactate decarboxylase